MSAQAPPPRHRALRDAAVLTLQATALGAVTGAAAALCYLAMIGLQQALWAQLGDAPWIIPLVTLAGGVLIGLTQLRAPGPDLELQIATARRPETVHLRQSLWVALGAIIAVTFGGAIGPEAGIIAVTAQLSAIMALRLGRTVERQRMLAEAGVSGALAGVYASPAGGPVHAEAEGRAPRPVPFAAGIAGFAAFVAVANGLWPGCWR